MSSPSTLKSSEPDAVVEYVADEAHMRELIDEWYRVNGFKRKLLGVAAGLLFLAGLYFFHHAWLTGELTGWLVAIFVTTTSGLQLWKTFRFKARWLNVVRSLKHFNTRRRLEVHNGVLHQVLPEPEEQDIVPQCVEFTETPRGVLLTMDYDWSDENVPGEYSASHGVVYIADRYVKGSTSRDELIAMIDCKDGVDGTLE